MSADLSQLAALIRNELVELQRAVNRVEIGWQKAMRSNDDYYLDSVALNLHGFYNGPERIFQRVAVVIDGSLPKGENWRQLLLEQMTKEVPTIRPAVISSVTCLRLDPYRGFRHIVRNVYTFKFNPTKIENLVADAYPLFQQTQAELQAFADFLDASSTSTT